MTASEISALVRAVTQMAAAFAELAGAMTRIADAVEAADEPDTEGDQ